MQARWSGMEAAVSAAREEAESAAAAAAKAEADLGALSTAYNGLEQHAFDMEEQLRQLQEQQQQQGAAAAGAAAAGGGLSEADVQARVQAALEQVRLGNLAFWLQEAIELAFLWITLLACIARFCYGGSLWQLQKQQQSAAAGCSSRMQQQVAAAGCGSRVR
jgi:hypothetical protein